MPLNTSRFRMERVFVLLIDEVPTLAFLAANHLEAQQLPKEDWLKEDLAELYSNGKALWSRASKAAVRAATDAEGEAYRATMSNRSNVSGELLLAYLVPIDSPRDGARSKKDLAG
jgi:hypothetical protein